MLSTHHVGQGKVNDTSNKADIVLYYNNKKGAVDTMDQLASTYTVRRKTRRWPMCVFGNIFDIAGIKKIHFLKLVSDIYFHLPSCYMTSRNQWLCSLSPTPSNVEQRHISQKAFIFAGAGNGINSQTF